MFIDEQATAAMRFKDQRSYMRRGKMFRFGEDMKDLRMLVFQRSKGFCEQIVRGYLHARCQRNISWETMELDHQPSLSQGGDDSLEGTVASCRRCHVSRHGRVVRSDKRKFRAGLTSEHASIPHPGSAPPGGTRCI